MKAIKVLYRLDNGDLESAIPTAFSLGYEEGETTFPEYGKLMVYLDNEEGLLNAQRLGHDAYTWWCRDPGQVEIWRVDCHNLYKMPAIIYASDLVAFQKPTVGMLEDFWALITLGDLGKVEEACERNDVSLINVTEEGIWSTDWLIPRERLGILPAGTWTWEWETL